MVYADLYRNVHLLVLSIYKDIVFKRTIESLAAKNVLNGDGTGKFRPEDAVTREEFVKMVNLSICYNITGSINMLLSWTAHL